jgi:hypothetical protein
VAERLQIKGFQVIVPAATILVKPQADTAMLKFTLNQALACIGLFAIGLGMMMTSTSPLFEDYEGWNVLFPTVLWYLGGMYIGVGVLAPFKKPWIGAWLGLTALCLVELCC